MIYEFSPKQDLHGYSKPWAPGAGKNLLPFEDGIDFTLYGVRFHTENGNMLVDGTSTGGISSGNQNFKDNFTITLAAGTYVLSWPTGTGYNNNLYNKSTGDSVVVSGLVTLEEETECYWGMYISADKTFAGIFEAQLEAGSSKTSYAPYYNICMPEGFNIWDPIEQEFIQVYAGYVNANTRELYLRPVYQEYAGEELVGPWMSSLDPYAEDTTPTEGAFVIDFGGELTSFEITPFMLQTLLDSLGIRQHFTDGAGLLNSLMDQAQGRVRSEEELLHLSRPLNVIAIGDQLPAGLTFKPISKDVLPGLPGKFIR